MKLGWGRLAREQRLHPQNTRKVHALNVDKYQLNASNRLQRIQLGDGWLTLPDD